jgi:hypothetical protein
MAEALFIDPGDRTTLQQWAARLAISERSLASGAKRDGNELTLAPATSFDDCPESSG